MEDQRERDERRTRERGTDEMVLWLDLLIILVIGISYYAYVMFVIDLVVVLFK